MPLIQSAPQHLDQHGKADSYVQEVYHQEFLKRWDNQTWRLNHLYQFIDAQGVQRTFSPNLTQKLLYLGLWYLNIILKSRQHGITTFACLLYLDICLFTPNISAAIIAHNREEAQEFFINKIKFAYDHLPPWVRKAVPAKRSSTRVLQFANGSSIRVTTSGRAGTFQLLHISELGKIGAKYPEKAREIVTGSLNTIHPGSWVIIESTAEGKVGPFYEICHNAHNALLSRTKLTKMDYKFFFFPWFRNPLNRLNAHVPVLDYQQKYFEELRQKHAIKLTKQQIAWYVKKWNTQGDDMRREHPSTPEEAFEATIRGVYYASEFTRLRKLGRITSVPHQPGVLVDTWWDIGMNHVTAIWFTQDIGREIHVIDYYENSGEGVGFYKRYLDSLAEKRGYVYGRHTGPHDLGVREWGNSGKTRLDSAAEIGLHFHEAPKLSIESGIERVRKVLGYTWFDEKRCTRKSGNHLVGIPSLENYRREWDERRETYKSHPHQDWATDGADAFRTLAVAHEFSTSWNSTSEIIATPPPDPDAWT